MKHVGRKFYHLAGGLALLSVYYLLGRRDALVFYAIAALTALGLDVLRLRVAALNRFVYERFPSFIRRSEEKKLTGTVPYVLGVGLSLYVYSTAVATVAICFLAFGDVSATLVGERWGKRKIGEKSLEGTAAFVLAAAAAGGLLSLAGLGVVPGVMLLGAVAAAGVEVLPLPVNDNLVIPVVSGGVMEIVLRLAHQ
jgi:acyl phosphate:glycerol-3-phosphate acyltransferase